jgi:hypothetical protein
MVGPLKAASPTIMIDELNQLVTGKCSSLTIAAATVQFVIDAVNGMASPTGEEYDRRIKRIIDDNVLDPEISWWEDNLKEMPQERKAFDREKMIEKDGHTDVASSRRMCMTIIEDAQDIIRALPKDGEASLPTWWTNKLATTAAYINSARDYLVYSDSTPEVNVEDIMDELEEVTEVLDDDMLPPSYIMMQNAS